MEKKFRVYEILEIAERVEHNAARFYLKAAELYDDTEFRDIYYKLANWRAKHEKVLTQRRKEYSEKTGELGTFDPNDYVLSNPEVMAGLTWIGSKTDPSRGLTGHETFTISGIKDGLTPKKVLSVRAAENETDFISFEVIARVDSATEVDYYRHGGILPYVLRQVMEEGEE